MAEIEIPQRAAHGDLPDVDRAAEIGQPACLDSAQRAIHLGPLRLHPGGKLLVLGAHPALVDHQHRGIENAVRRRLERQLIPFPRPLPIEARPGAIVEKGADHPAVIDRRPRITFQRGDLRQRVLRDQRVRRRQRRDRDGHQFDLADLAGLVQDHQDLADKGRGGGLVELHGRVSSLAVTLETSPPRASALAREPARDCWRSAGYLEKERKDKSLMSSFFSKIPGTTFATDADPGPQAPRIKAARIRGSEPKQ